MRKHIQVKQAWPVLPASKTLYLRAGTTGDGNSNPDDDMPPSSSTGNNG